MRRRLPVRLPRQRRYAPGWDPLSSGQVLSFPLAALRQSPPEGRVRAAGGWVCLCGHAEHPGRPCAHPGCGCGEYRPAILGPRRAPGDGQNGRAAWGDVALGTDRDADQ